MGAREGESMLPFTYNYFRSQLAINIYLKSLHNSEKSQLYIGSSPIVRPATAFFKETYLRYKQKEAFSWGF